MAFAWNSPKKMEEKINLDKSKETCDVKKYTMRNWSSTSLQTVIAVICTDKLQKQHKWNNSTTTTTTNNNNNNNSDNYNNNNNNNNNNTNNTTTGWASMLDIHGELK